ncbi:MAG: transglycosylase SLT domain-containing protein [Thiotrichales bacterium]
MKVRSGLIVLFAVIMLASSPVIAGSGSRLSSEQDRFLRALDALAKGDEVKFRQLKSSLEGYLLYPYLEYRDLSRRLGDSSAIKTFLKSNKDTAIATQLRLKWLHKLGAKKQWKTYLSAYEPVNNTKLQCYYLQAGLQTKKQKAKFIKQAKELWMTGSTLPTPCSPVFNYLYDHNKIKPQEFWQRISLAMEKRNTKLARFLAKKLPPRDKGLFDQWLRMDKNPEAVLKEARQWPDRAQQRDIIAYGVRRYSRADTVIAWNDWQNSIKERFSFDQETIDKVERSLALRAAWRHLPEADLLLSSLDVSAIDKETREWKIRSALRNGNWHLARENIYALPDEELITNQWQYWSARVHEQLGQTEYAHEIYDRLSRETDYYGFLASEKLGRDYTFNNEPVVNADDAYHVAWLANQPEMQRISELYKLNQTTDAYREWRYTLKRLSVPEKRSAARLAQSWGWHFTAIATTAQAKHFADLDLRFPLIYQPEVMREARRQNLPPSLVYGVMRRESAFRETAVSPAGALGLMQVMPRTARAVGKTIGFKKLSTAQIKDANNNIRLGSTYLRQVLDKYDNNEILATASYNAGPNRVKKWLPENSLPADIWVDTITFDETRAYVKAVLFYSTIFDWKLDNKVDHTLDDRMRPVTPLTAIPSTPRS